MAQLKHFPKRFINVYGTKERVVNPDWLKAQIEIYNDQKEQIYNGYAAFLEKVLRNYCSRYAPLAIVQARAKGKVSFAEKAALKACKYEDEPIYQMTDLCGARIILQTTEEVEAACRFLRREFDIDEKTRLDARSRLQSDQFGYSGFHLIVQVKEKCSNILGVETPDSLTKSIREDTVQRPKAEIQVRTVAEHAWADTFHDRLYKTAVKIPESYKREAARIAAVLEDIDDNAGSLAARLDAYTGHYRAYMSDDDIRNRIALLQTIMDSEKRPEKLAALALRIAHMTASLGNYSQVIGILSNFLQAEPPEGDRIRFEFGTALCRCHAETSDTAELEKGREMLEIIEATQECPPSLRAASAAELARSFSAVGDGEMKALKWFRRAVRHAPDNPYYLTSFLEYDSYIMRKPPAPSTLWPVLENALTVCREHIRVGIELPHAYSTLGRLYLMSDREKESLSAYAKAIDFCRTHESCTFDRNIESELRFLQRINYPNYPHELPHGHDIIRRFLLLAKAWHGNPKAMEEVGSMAVRKDAPVQPVLLLVGGASHMPEEKLDDFKQILYNSLKDFQGTVICGGTRAGIPGALGDIVAQLKNEHEGECPFDALGYLPARIPVDAVKDEKNYRLFTTNGDGFSAAEPLQGWIDLLAAGVRPEDVRMLGYDGGDIAALEYRLALALGATSGVLTDSGRAAAELFKDEQWKDNANLFALPFDNATVRMFVNSTDRTFDEEQLQTMGRAFHESYVANSTSRLPDNMQPWENLGKSFKNANIEQARYCAAILEDCGFNVRPASDPDNASIFDGFTDEEIESMAEMEHGRWNIERLRDGWRFGKPREDSQKIHDCLLPWSQLPEDIKSYDRNAVQKFPEILAFSGLEVTRPEKNN